MGGGNTIQPKEFDSNSHGKVPEEMPKSGKLSGSRQIKEGMSNAGRKMKEGINKAAEVLNNQTAKITKKANESAKFQKFKGHTDKVTDKLNKLASKLGGGESSKKSASPSSKVTSEDSFDREPAEERARNDEGITAPQGWQHIQNAEELLEAYQKDQAALSPAQKTEAEISKLEAKIQKIKTDRENAIAGNRVAPRNIRDSSQAMLINLEKQLSILKADPSAKPAAPARNIMEQISQKLTKVGDTLIARATKVIEGKKLEPKAQQLQEALLRFGRDLQQLGDRLKKKELSSAKDEAAAFKKTAADLKKLGNQTGASRLGQGLQKLADSFKAFDKSLSAKLHPNPSSGEVKRDIYTKEDQQAAVDDWMREVESQEGRESEVTKSSNPSKAPRPQGQVFEDDVDIGEEASDKKITEKAEDKEFLEQARADESVTSKKESLVKGESAEDKPILRETKLEPLNGGAKIVPSPLPKASRLVKESLVEGDRLNSNNLDAFNVELTNFNNELDNLDFDEWFSKS